MVTVQRIIPPAKTVFPIVCIGASAGGLEAFQELLKNCSNEPGLAFVIIMHLAPERKSMLSELLSRTTKMPVCEATHKMTLEVNHVYIIPPKKNMTVASGKLMLTNLDEPDLRHMPIDCFFRSLAKEQQNRAIGVILSGTATDGTLGAEAIKAEGGIVFAQDEASSKYDGMPQSAINSGCVDFVLPPEKIAHELERIAVHPYMSPMTPAYVDESLLTKDKGLDVIFELLRRAKGLDFTHYKMTTIGRRVTRRMVLLKLTKLAAYTKFLRENKDEIDYLYEDLLINVTSFFRDPDVFSALKKQVLPSILKNKKKGQVTRIWVPGCSNGEEAYSIAICVLELLGNKAVSFPVQIFATDVLEKSIRRARKGIFGKKIKDHITPERLKRFFTEESGSYTISSQLREMCVFSKQNVFSDPPFSNMDLISCRNLLIYFQPVLQKKVFHNFHYALRPDGFLLLGKSEAVSGCLDLFKALGKKQKIFTRKNRHFEVRVDAAPKYYLPHKLEIMGKIVPAETKEPSVKTIESQIDRIVLREYAPCGVLINGNMEIVQYRGRTGRYLEAAHGRPSMNLLKLARDGLFLPLRAAIIKAKKTKRTVKETADRVHITVVPVKLDIPKEEFFLVLFDEMDRAVGLKNLPKSRGKHVKDEKVVAALQKEIIETKEYLQSVLEDQEHVNEEVKVANEELQSSNEELQSTNEEMETSKEELQSTNEELMTTNDELQSRATEVTFLNNDLLNVLNSINTPIIMMGTDLVIRRVTPQAEKILNVIPSDIGRPISKIKLTVDIPDFEKMLIDVMASLHPKTFEIKDKEGSWFSVSLRPYRTQENKIDGVVAVFVDITENKKVQKKIETARTYAEAIVETVPEPLLTLSADLRILSANKAFYKTFQVDPNETKGRLIYDLGNRQWDIPELRQLLEEILPRHNTIEAFEVEHKFKNIGQKTMLLNARRIFIESDNLSTILLAIMDITDSKKVEIQQKKLSEMKDDFVSTVSHELRTPLTVISLGLDNLQGGLLGPLNKDQAEAIERNVRNAKRLAKLIDNLLDVSRLESNRNMIVKQKIDLKQLIHYAVQNFRLGREDGVLLLKEEMAEALPPLMCDPDLISEVLCNIVGNAIRYAKKTIVVTTKLVKETDGTPKEIQTSVTNDGDGIPHERLGDLFQKFVQLDRKKGTFTYKGTGLGLAISKEIIEQHKGKIWAESPEQKSVTFHFTLPILAGGVDDA